MKIRKVIEELQKIAEEHGDEQEVVTDGYSDIWYIDPLPGYYDGYPDILIREENNPYFNILGFKNLKDMERDGEAKGKVVIYTFDKKDAVYHNYYDNGKIQIPRGYVPPPDYNEMWDEFRDKLNAYDEGSLAIMDEIHSKHFEFNLKAAAGISTWEKDNEDENNATND